MTGILMALFGIAAGLSACYAGGYLSRYSKEAGAAVGWAGVVAVVGAMLAFVVQVMPWSSLA